MFSVYVVDKYKELVYLVSRYDCHLPISFECRIRFPISINKCYLLGKLSSCHFILLQSYELKNQVKNNKSVGNLSMTKV